ncbi:MAG: NAD(P)-dependent oxidoreductase, partial [Pirellulaceae bacterium]|nr:NAD(P)-dependent oxidoreductase [Pirellulaceae bacterium]
METVFVSGPTGCIGSATVSYLLDHGVDRVVGFCRRRDMSRIDERYHDRIELIEGDITSRDDVVAAVGRASPSSVIHLAAFQTPDCQSNPLLGLDVNVAGTINIFRAAQAAGGQLQRVVFASSAAVYGPRSLYSGATVDSADPYLPPNLYGYWKVAGEGMGQAFHRETGVSTVSLRLATTYGPGRDRGLTSAPTTALKAAALGAPFQMPYQGREHYHFVEDVGAGFAQAAIEPFAGYGAFNLRGRTVQVADFVALIREHLPEANIGIADDADTMPFVCDLGDTETV